MKQARTPTLFAAVSVILLVALYFFWAAAPARPPLVQTVRQLSSHPVAAYLPAQAKEETPEEEEKPTPVHRGWQVFALGRWDISLRLAEDELGKDSRNAELWYLRARSLSLFGHDKKEVDRSLEMALSADPTYFPAAMQWTAEHAQEISAEELQEKWEAAGFSEAEVTTLRGQQLSVQQDKAGAIELFHLSLDDDNRSAETRVALATALMHTGEIEKAVAEYKLAYRLDPVRIDAGLEAALLLRKAKQYDAADELIETIRSNNPGLFNSHADAVAWMAYRGGN